MLELLRVHVEKQGKAFEITAPGRSGFDACAPDGFDGFDGPVFIECRLSLTAQRLKDDAQKFVFFAAPAQSEAGLEKGTILYILDEPESSRFSSVAAVIDQLQHHGIRLQIWSWPELERIANHFPNVAQEIVENLLPLRVRRIVSSSDINWTTERDKRVAALSERLSSGQSTLFLGAGVSASAGMPDWDTLLNALFVSYLDGIDKSEGTSNEENLELVTRMNALDSRSALVSARYVRKALAETSGSSNAFTDAIRRALYDLRRKEFDISSSLLSVLVEMCIPRRSGTLVSAVVTYNFDDLFERELKRRAVLHKCVYKATEPPDIDDLPVYHVHGFVPEDTTPYDGVEECTLVFSEEGYHQIYTDSYHWSNLVQLNALRNSTCVMVGLSIADPNLRRLLEISQRGYSDSRHFAFMRRTSTKRFCEKSGKLAALRMPTEKAESFLTRHHATTEALMRELGVTVIWYEEHDEIPRMLQGIAFPTRDNTAPAARI